MCWVKFECTEILVSDNKASKYIRQIFRLFLWDWFYFEILGIYKLFLILYLWVDISFSHYILYVWLDLCLQAFCMCILCDDFLASTLNFLLLFFENFPNKYFSSFLFILFLDIFFEYSNFLRKSKAFLLELSNLLRVKLISKKNLVVQPLRLVLLIGLLII